MGLTAEIKKGMFIMYNNEPHLIIEREFYAPAKGASFNRTKLKNLKKGKIITHVFKSVEKVEELDVATKTMQFLYTDETDAFFMDPISFEQFSLPLEQISGGTDYLHANGKYIMMLYADSPLSVQLPGNIELTIIETAGAVSKGNTSGNATKQATLETGMKIQVPLFINQGDKISINTELGTYISKVS
ncbi:MAG TPA: elongation factor P [Candidatus Dojkabacteria bacterium]|nr:elongation factor P [Candidatus Dojkabacteria bacterium]